MDYYKDLNRALGFEPHPCFWMPEQALTKLTLTLVILGHMIIYDYLLGLNVFNMKNKTKKIDFYGKDIWAKQKI